MAGLSQGGVQVGRRKPVIQEGPAREILSESPSAGCGRTETPATRATPSGSAPGPVGGNLEPARCGHRRCRDAVARHDWHDGGNSAALPNFAKPTSLSA